MKRKIVQQGPNTLGVSIPSKWIKRRGVKKGDEVEVIETNYNLIIGSDKKPLTEKIIHIPLSSLPPGKDNKPDTYLLRTIIINSLRKGYNKVKITFENPKMLPYINKIVYQVLGYEIIEQQALSCTIESMVDLKNTELEKYFKKFQIMIKNFSNLVSLNLLKEQDNYDEILSSFELMERHYNTICRILMNNYQEETREKMFLLLAIFQMYEAIRNMHYGVKVSKEKKLKLDKNTKKYIKDVLDYVDSVLKFITLKDYNLVKELSIGKNKLTYHYLNPLISRKSNDNPVILLFSFVARRFWDAVGPYLGSIN